MFAAHARFVGNLFDAELLTEMIAAEACGAIQLIARRPAGLGGLLPPIDEKGVGAQADLRTVGLSGHGE